LAGPFSEYYVSQFGQIAVLQGDEVVRTWLPQTGTSGAFAIAVRDTVETFSTVPGGLGAEYSLSGTPTETTYRNTAPATQFFDGATDGSSNYAWDFSNGAVYRFSAEWSNPEVLFTLGTDDGSRIGITFDRSNDTLWLSGWSGTVGTLVENRALDGSLLASFSTGHPMNTGLALDPADDTLWLLDRGSLVEPEGLRFEQFSKSGTLLQSVRYPSLRRVNTHGGEFQIISEPATEVLAYLAIPFFLIAATRRR